MKALRKTGLFVILGLTIVGVSCSTKSKDYSVLGCLTTEQQSAILSEMVHYASRLAPQATHETKFNPEFDWYYNRAVSECTVVFCNDKGENQYELLVTRKARSITPMKDAIALEIQLNEKGYISTYKEVFRMWKMPEDTLLKRGKFLFDLMVRDGDLSLYYSKFQRDQYIEYPDDRFSFDTLKRRWRDSELDTLQLQ